MTLLPRKQSAAAEDSGGGGIRTHGTREGTLVFKTSAFNRSATPPNYRHRHNNGEPDVSRPAPGGAERVGFEPTMSLLDPYSLSRGAPSASSATSPVLRRRPVAALRAAEKNTCLPVYAQTRATGPTYASRASAPLVISISSFVIASCRARLYFSRRSRNSSSALDVALSIATMRAPCSAALDSRRARQTS